MVHGRELDATYTGLLLFETKRFLALVNHVRDGADFGPLKTRRDDHVTPECFVTVIPCRRVRRVVFMKDVR